MRDSLKRHWTKSLLEAKDYRSFLSAVIEPPEGERKLSYSDLSRRAGFSARSYPREVVTGRRRITPKTLPQFISGLRLTGDEKSYFTLLVAACEPDVNSSGLSAEEIAQKLSQIRERILKRGKASPAKADSFLSGEHLFEIYAALGSRERGSDLARIARLTGLPESTCLKGLEPLCADQVVHYDSDRGKYFPTDLLLSFEGLGGLAFFKRHYLKALGDVSQRARLKFESKKDLYFNSVFSVDSRRAAEFKEEFRKLLLEFIDRGEEADGDALAKVTVAFEVGPG